MNLPNWITLSRLPLLFVIVLLLYVQVKWTSSVALVLFLIGAWTDWLDGYIARRYNIVSNLGKVIDALSDKILTIGLFVALYAFAVLPGWSVFLVLIIILREFIITGLRLVAATKGEVLAAERAGKVKTVFQLVSLGALILFEALVEDFSRVLPMEWIRAVYFLGFGSFIIATYLTASSGVQYLVKYWRLFKEEG